MVTAFLAEFRMRQWRNSVWASWILSLSLLAGVLPVDAQHAAVESSPTASPSSTPAVFSPQTLADLKRLQQEALNSDYAYRQVAHLANNIGPRLSGSAQAAKA